jgi:DNA polymerase-3 subunit delta
MSAEAAPAELKPVYLLTGSDRPKVQRALARLRARFAEGAVELLSAHEAGATDAIAACNALGLFGEGGRLVIVDAVDRWKAADAKALAAYLSNPAPQTVLALVGEQIKRDAPLAKTCGKAGDVLVFDVSKRELPRWVAEQFRRLSVEADEDACRALVALVGEDAFALANEVEKLTAWSGGEPIDQGAVEALVGPAAEVPVFAITDAWGTRDPARALTACEEALERSPDPASVQVAKLAGGIARHVARVITAQRLAAEGVRPRDALSELDARSPYTAEKAFRHARDRSRDELETDLVRLADLDLALKGGSRLAPELELERALSDLTAPPEAAPEGGRELD